MTQLEPTYLRYIYDGLVKGSIHPENSAELPEGLIGLYEQAFDERVSAIERQKLLRRLAIWTLLKKEVSIGFVAEVLEEKEEDVQAFIFDYSSWFNSPKVGKYQLYHERIKVYLLQKLSQSETEALHKNLISRLEIALQEQLEDEFEVYGLEFLSAHYSVEAMLTEDGSKLLKLAYDSNNWERQIKISKGYLWTKSGLQYVMTWASKFNNEEVIECGLKMVELGNKEQNAALEIIQMFADGDFDSALLRIENFGGADQEGLKDKLILYILCLMELSFLTIDKEFLREQGIRKLLDHLDKNIPVDELTVNWQSFISEYPIFRMAKKKKKLSLDYTVLHRRLGSNRSWKLAKEDVLDNWIPRAENHLESIEIMFNLAKAVSDPRECCRQLNEISMIVWNSGDLNKAVSILEESKNTVGEISNDEDRLLLLVEIARTLVGIGEVQIALNYLDKLTDLQKTYALREVSSAVFNVGQYEKAFLIAKSILSLQEQIKILVTFSKDLFLLGEKERAAKLLSDTYLLAKEHSIDYDLAILASISSEFHRQGDQYKALIIMEEIEELLNKCNDTRITEVVLKSLCCEYAFQGKVKAMNRSIESLSNKNLRQDVLVKICERLLSEKMFSECYLISDNIENSFDRSEIRKDLAVAFAEKNQLEKVKKYINHLHEEVINEALIEISEVFAKNGKIEECNLFLQDIKDEDSKCKALSKVSISYNKAGLYIEASKSSANISDDKLRRNTLIANASEFGKSESWEDFVSLLKTSLRTELSIDPKEKLDLLKCFAKAFVSNGEFEKARLCVRMITDEFTKSWAKQDIAIELTKIGETEMAIKEAESISADMFSIRDMAFSKISEELFFQDKRLEAIKVSKLIEQDWIYESTIKKSSKLSAKSGNQSIMKELEHIEDKDEKLEQISSWIESCSVKEIQSYGTVIIPLLTNEKGILVSLLKKLLVSRSIFEIEGLDTNFSKNNEVIDLRWALYLKTQIDKL